jgi:hypothetical protein
VDNIKSIKKTAMQRKGKEESRNEERESSKKRKRKAKPATNGHVFIDIISTYIVHTPDCDW